MKIYICASKHNYSRVAEVKEALEAKGHEITLPNFYNAPMTEEAIKLKGSAVHKEWKAECLRAQEQKVINNDVMLVLNYEKQGQLNYIGGATFLEVYEAWKLGKKIFFMNPIPEGMLADELNALNPTVLNGDLSKLMPDISEA